MAVFVEPETALLGDEAVLGDFVVIAGLPVCAGVVVFSDGLLADRLGEWRRGAGPLLLGLSACDSGCIDSGSGCVGCDSGCISCGGNDVCGILLFGVYLLPKAAGLVPAIGEALT